MEKIFNKIKKNGYDFNGLIPECRMLKNGKFSLSDGGFWTDGFYIGVFNLAYALTNDKDFLEIASKYDEFLERRILNTDEINEKYNYLKLDHDVGFIFLPASGFHYKLFKDDKSLDILIKAAEILYERFNEQGNFIRAWDTWRWDTDLKFIEEKKGKVIIDSMMNIPLLFQVSEYTGNNKYRDIAIKHADTVAQYIIRDDYSTFHSFNFDYKTGEPICGKTVQGYSDDSCWSRGQSWAVYGFALAYKYTRDEKYLNISKKTAEYFMNNLSVVDLPCWDFAAQDEAFYPWDSSAAVVCASGMLEIYSETNDSKYLEYANRLIRAVERFCLTEDYENCQPLVLHGCVGSAFRSDNPNTIVNTSIDEALVYADYFYMECKLKLSGNKLRIF